MHEVFPAAAKPMAFIVTRERPRALAFYRDVLGFALCREDAFAAVFDMNGILLRVATVGTLSVKGVRFTRCDGFGQDSLGIWTAPRRVPRPPAGLPPT